MTSTLKAIDTRYKGHLFHSRLEARWAVAFDVHRVAWDYEPEGFDLGASGFYLPDFWLPQVSMWAEVKPCRPAIDELQKARALACQSDHPVLLLIGKPSYGAHWAVHPDSDKCCYGQDRLDDGTPVRTLDYEIFEHSYHLSEHRFYSSSGYAAEFPMPASGSNPWANQEQCPIEAALSARFEHGRSGPTL